MLEMKIAQSVYTSTMATAFIPGFIITKVQFVFWFHLQLKFV